LGRTRRGLLWPCAGSAPRRGFAPGAIQRQGRSTRHNTRSSGGI